MKFIKTSAIIFFLIFSSCVQQKSKPQSDNVKPVADTNYHLINVLGVVYGDTTKFTKLRCGLYQNTSGVIAFKTVDNTYKMDTTGQSGPLDVYIATIYNADPADSLKGGLKEMQYVVDTSTFEILGWEYFKDKNHVYHFTPRQDGGSISVVDNADPKSFRVLASYLYAMDKSHCFYRSTIIEEADRKSFVADTSLAEHFAYDKNHYYDGDVIMSNEEVKEYRLNSRQGK